MAQYSKAEKTLHKFYLSNYFISRATLEMEEILFGQKAGANPVKEYVFITGLARSGTTALMNKIFQTGEYASLQYSNMPILLAPNLWNKKLKLESHERAHNDGIIIDGNSPEEFDEYFWKVFLKDSYIDGKLFPHELEEAVLNKFKSYVALICLSKGKNKYISKNNNNILRLPSLATLDNSRIIILFRDPLSHSASLMKLDKSFSKNQKEDPFVLDYFNYLGHHEFGLGHKPFAIGPEKIDLDTGGGRENIEYWIRIWINYYQHLLNNWSDEYLLISFEDLTSNPDVVYKTIKTRLNVEADFPNLEKHIPSKYSIVKSESSSLKKAKDIYKTLTSLKQY